MINKQMQKKNYEVFDSNTGSTESTQAVVCYPLMRALYREYRVVISKLHYMPLIFIRLIPYLMFFVKYD